MSQSNMDNRLSAADYDVDRVTERSYAVVLRSYCVFHGIEVDSCSAIDFTDTKVAVFLKDAGIRRLYSRSTEKTYCAALGAAFLRFGVTGFRAEPSQWPITQKVLMVSITYSFLCKIFFMIIFIRILGAIGSDVHWFLSRRRSLARNASMQSCVWTLNPAWISNLLLLLS